MAGCYIPIPVVCNECSKAPYIGENGNWWIGGEDTGISAQGPAGPKGEKGDRGSQGENAAIGDDVVYPVIYSDGDSFLVASGMEL